MRVQGAYKITVNGQSKKEWMRELFRKRDVLSEQKYILIHHSDRFREPVLSSLQTG